MSSLGPAVRKVRALTENDPIDKIVEEAAIANKERLRKEVDKHKFVPNTLSLEIKKALG